MLIVCRIMWYLILDFAIVISEYPHWSRNEKVRSRPGLYGTIFLNGAVLLLSYGHLTYNAYYTVG